MIYCFTDLECTCWAKNDPEKSFHEIIEIGVVLINKLEVLGEFQGFVQPTFNRTLSTYCKELTTITQDQVNNGLPFEKVMTLLEQWIVSKTQLTPKDITLVSWGNFDRAQFEDDCERNSYLYPFNRHLNLKIAFSEFLNKPKKKFGLSKAARICGLKFEGTHHRALDDTRMVVEIFKFMIKNGFDVDIYFEEKRI